MLRAVEPDNWNFILTVAGVFVAATRLKNQHLGNAPVNRNYGTKPTSYLFSGMPTQVEPSETANRFFERNYDALTEVGHEPRFVTSNSIGFRIVWNVLGRAPHSEEQRKLVLTAPQLINILRRTIVEDQRLSISNPLSYFPLGFALLVSLERVFSCLPQSN